MATFGLLARSYYDPRTRLLDYQGMIEDLEVGARPACCCGTVVQVAAIEGGSAAACQPHLIGFPRGMYRQPPVQHASFMTT